MNNEIEFDHFKDINDLLKNIDSWYREDDIEYTRWFGLEDLYNLKIYITSLQQKVEQLEKENKELRDENKRIFQNVNDDELLISNAMNYAELKKAEKRVEQLENIRKEAIEYLKDEGNIIDRFWKHDFREYPDYDPFNAKDEEEVRCVELYGYDDLLNILNKGEISKYE